MRTIGFFLCLSACSALPVSALIRSPVDSKCQSYGLKGCPELVDGAIAYVEGDKPMAMQKLQAARALNTPTQLKQFATALRTIGEASPEAGQPLIEVATILTGEPGPTATPPGDSAAAVAAGTAPNTATPPKPVAAVAPSAAPARDRRGPNPERLALLALTARDDPMRQVTETVLVAQAPGADCQVAGNHAVCARRRQGPVIVTDIRRV